MLNRSVWKKRGNHLKMEQNNVYYDNALSSLIG